MSLLLQGPLLCGEAYLTQIEHWTPEQFDLPRTEMLEFLRGIVSGSSQGNVSVTHPVRFSAALMKDRSIVVPGTRGSQRSRATPARDALERRRLKECAPVRSERLSAAVRQNVSSRVLLTALPETRSQATSAATGARGRRTESFASAAPTDRVKRCPYLCPRSPVIDAISRIGRKS